MSDTEVGMAILLPVFIGWLFIVAFIVTLYYGIKNRKRRRGKWILRGFATVILLYTLAAIIAAIYEANTDTTSSYTPNTQAKVAEKQPTFEEEYAKISPEKMFKIVNNTRSAHGLYPYSYSDILAQSAQDKCNDMVRRDYYAHDGPRGEQWGDFLTPLIPEKNWQGSENIVQGYSYHTDNNNKGIIKSFMDSKSHREAILDQEYTYFGTAKCFDKDYKGEKVYYVVQHFMYFN